MEELGIPFYIIVGRIFSIFIWLVPIGFIVAAVGEFKHSCRIDIADTMIFFGLLSCVTCVSVALVNVAWF